MLTEHCCCSRVGRAAAGCIAGCVWNVAPVHEGRHLQLQRDSAHDRLRCITGDTLHKPRLGRTRHTTLANSLALVALLERLAALRIAADTPAQPHSGARKTFKGREPAPQGMVSKQIH